MATCRSASCDGSVRIWDVQLRTCLMTLLGHEYVALCCFWSCIYAYSAHRKVVCSLAFSPCAEYMATGSVDGRLNLWDLKVSPCPPVPLPLILCLTSTDHRNLPFYAEGPLAPPFLMLIGLVVRRRKLSLANQEELPALIEWLSQQQRAIFCCFPSLAMPVEMRC